MTKTIIDIVQNDSGGTNPDTHAHEDKICPCQCQHESFPKGAFLVKQQNTKKEKKRTNTESISKLQKNQRRKSEERRREMRKEANKKKRKKANV